MTQTAAVTDPNQLAAASGMSAADINALQKQLFPSGNVSTDEMQLVIDTLEANKSRTSQTSLSQTDGWANTALTTQGTYGMALPGFSFPATMSASDFHQALTEAESFANMMGWADFPAPQDVVSLMSGNYLQDPQSAYAYLFSKLGTAMQQQKPWGQYGMQAQQYQDTITGLTTFMQDLTGSGGIDPALLQQYLKNRWSTTDLLTHLKGDQAFMDAHPWMKFGQTYTQWQQTQLTSAQSFTDQYEQLTGNRNIDPALLSKAVQGRMSGGSFDTMLRTDAGLLGQYGYLDQKYGNYTAALWTAHKLQARQGIVARFGEAGVNDANYLSDLSSPLVAAPGGGGGAVKQQDRRAANVGQSEVR